MAGHSNTATLKLLVVEDSTPVRRCMVGELRDMPEVAEVVETGDKASALDALSAGAPDVVILDVQLPDGSGLDLLRALRKSGAASGIIIFSNLTSRPLADGCAELKPDFIFHKSADFEEVKAAVRLLGGRRRPDLELPHQAAPLISHLRQSMTRHLLLLVALAASAIHSFAFAPVPDLSYRGTGRHSAPSAPAAPAPAAIAAPPAPVVDAAEPDNDQLSVRTTAYTAAEPGGANSAIGTRLKYGGAIYSAASDWSWLPLGTRFRMRETGRIYVIEDYGSALVGRKTIDLFMPSNGAMRNWGVRKVNIEILQWGSWEKSLAILKDRTRNSHVRRMVASLRQRKANEVLLAGAPAQAAGAVQ